MYIYKIITEQNVQLSYSNKRQVNSTTNESSMFVCYDFDF